MYVVCGILFLCIWTCVANAKPCCKIKTIDIGLMWDCSRCGLTEIPPNPPENIKAVSFEANEIKEIPKGRFRNYNHLVRLQLTNNSLTLQNGTAHFDELPKLTYLALARNPIVLSNLSEQNPDIFKPLVSITEFNMYRTEYNIYDDRHFAEYPGKFLAPLKNLMYLHLPAVSFEKFGDYFINLTKLHVVSFLGSMPGGKVLWTEMKNETFINLPYMKTLNLVDSSLKTIDPLAFFMLENLHTIQVSCSKLQAIELLNAIENIPKPTLTILMFEYDKSLDDVPRNKTFPSLSNLSWVMMGIPVLVPHPNPFILEFLPIFWPSVRRLEIFRPYSNVYVDTTYRNPDDPNAPILQITVSNTLKHLPYRSACIMTSLQTKVRATGSSAKLRSRFSRDTAMARQLSIQAKKKTVDSMEMNSTVKKRETDIITNGTIQSSNRPHQLMSSSGPVGAWNSADTKYLHPSCYSGLYSANICHRLLSLTLTFFISYTQSQVFDLLIYEGASLGIHTNLIKLTVNQFLYDTLPGDLILQNLVEFNIEGAGVQDLAPRNMPDLKIYDFSNNLVKDLCNTNAVSQLHNLEVFNASNNNLRCIDALSFKDAYKLSHVDLGKNDLQSIMLNISHLKKLQTINLRGNSIKYFASAFTEQISNQSKVLIDLSYNLLTCACGHQYTSFISWLISHSNIFIGFEEYKCVDKNGDIRLVKAFDMDEYKAECRSKLPVYVAVPVSCSIIVIIVMTVSYKQRWRIMWYTYTLTNCCKRRRRRRQINTGYEQLITDPSDEQEYDLFLGYEQYDAEIRAAVLEKLQELRLSVIHPDILEYGRSIFGEGTIGIQQSRKVVFLITTSFAQCNICDFLLHMALMKGIENVILLQVDSLYELNNAGMNAFLRSMLKSGRTYPYDDNECFWNTFQGLLDV